MVHENPVDLLPPRAPVAHALLAALVHVKLHVAAQGLQLKPMLRLWLRMMTILAAMFAIGKGGVALLNKGVERRHDCDAVA